MDKEQRFVLNHILIFGELFFFTTEGIQKNEAVVHSAFADLYKNISFN
ncbi:MAG: hypothetical protein VW397_01800 [Candidatus Margulisiibacteriota bacterium]